MINSHKKDRQSAATSLLGTPREPLALRMHGSHYDGQIVRVGGAKCSIGSGPDCDIRLCEDDIAAVHCLILRGDRGTVVRRWSSDTRLNGLAFDDAWLHEGDRIAVGSFEFELIDSADAEPVEKDSDDAPNAPSIDDVADIRQELASTRRELEVLQSRGDTLDCKIDEVASRHEQFAENWNSQHSQPDPALEERIALIEQLAAEVLEFKAEFEAQQLRWRENSRPQVASTQMTAPQLSDEDAQFVSLPADAPIDPCVADPPASPSRTMVLDNPGILPWQADETEPSTETPWTGAVADPIPAENRQNEDETQPLLDIHDEIAVREESATKPIAFTQPTQSQDQQDESIEQYMARLLQRVSGDSSRSATKPAYRPATQPVAVVDMPQTKRPTADASSVITQSDVRNANAPAAIESDEFSPRTQAPEQSIRLAAMRELANQSTRQALDTSIERRKFSAAVTRLSMSVVGLTTGAILMLLSDGFGVVFFAALAFLLATCGLAVHSLQSVRSKDSIAGDHDEDAASAN